jgi:uncharacterized membrane protein
MSTLNDLKEKIHSLEAERIRLANEVEIMRKAAEDRAMALTENINELREESKTLRELLFSNEKIEVAGSTLKPVPDPSFESNAETVPESPAQTIVREKANTQAFVSKPVVAPAVDAIPQSAFDVVPQMSAHVVPQNVSDISAQEVELEKSGTKDEIPSQDVDSKTLTAEERKIIDILCDHGGRYARANIRAEAGLGWLQTNRVISHLAERGVIGLEKSGASLELVLKETPE